MAFICNLFCHVPLNERSFCVPCLHFCQVDFHVCIHTSPSPTLTQHTPHTLHSPTYIYPYTLTSCTLLSSPPPSQLPTLTPPHPSTSNPSHPHPHTPSSLNPTLNPQSLTFPSPHPLIPQPPTLTSSPPHRFLLCNQALLAPAVPRLPFRQHSATSQSSTIGASEDFEEPLTVGTGSAEMLSSEGAAERHKLTKGTSSEDEVARLTIEVLALAMHVCSAVIVNNRKCTVCMCISHF